VFNQAAEVEGALVLAYPGDDVEGVSTPPRAAGPYRNAAPAGSAGAASRERGGRYRIPRSAKACVTTVAALAP
jgi:hypothetical protein